MVWYPRYSMRPAYPIKKGMRKNSHRKLTTASDVMMATAKAVCVL